MSGRGRGRGRGRGPGGQPRPMARDDEGQVLAVQGVEGPPPLYPDNERLQPPQKPTHELERLILRRRSLREFYQASPYHLSSKDVQRAESKSADYAERYADREKNKQKVQREPLSLLITQDPRYFPAELFGTRQQSAAAAARAQREYWAKQKARQAEGQPPETLELMKLEELAKRESKAGAGGGTAAGASSPLARGGAGAGAEEEGGPIEGEEEEDAGEMEDNPEEDDYYQNEYYDDDEEYGDYDDGGDEGATF